ncbi:MAG: hypothetical protein JWN08_894 [Frankiales bacterium]|nr:hypothetical protein [Frankiales bacterium]
MKGIARALVALGVGVAAVVVPAGAGARAADACPRGWGSMPETAGTPAVGTVRDVRAGRHACFDRVVVDLLGDRPGQVDVRYVATVRRDGSGQRVPLRGGAFLQVVVRSPSYDSDTGRLLYRPADPNELAPVRGSTTLRQLAYAGSFEGQTTLGVGVRARLPFRVLLLTGPPRVVVDVAHRW